MKKNRLLLGLILLVLTIISCEKEKESELDLSSCDETVILSDSLYEDTTFMSSISIISAEIIDDCLEIKFGASGCDGNSWEYYLVDSEHIMLSNPPGRDLRLALKNEELCLAVFTREVSYDITPLQIEGFNTISLFVLGIDSVLTYTY